VKVLFFAMPDTVSALDAVLRMPNLGLCSIAGNLEGCDVKVVDLAFHSRRLTQYVRSLMDEVRPDLVGLSAMSFQFASACRVAGICRSANPAVKVALGGYHASLMCEEIAAGKEAGLFDFMIRGEGEITFNRLVQEIISGREDFGSISGLSFRTRWGFQHNQPAPLADLDEIRLPDRGCRLLHTAHFFGQPFDCVETSRGCSMGCNFCSITQMYGRSIRFFKPERVIAELKLLKQKGTRGVFFVDDNITLDVRRLKKLCEMIAAENLNTMSYAIQASVKGISSDPELAACLKKANFIWVFLGIESGIGRNLESMGKEGVLNNTQLAISLLQAQDICVFGGFIVGNPEDTRQDILYTYRFALDSGVDHPIIQCLTPYPRTNTREELMAEGLITNGDDFSRYNGFICNVRTRHLSNSQLSQAMMWGGIKLYFHPRYLKRSRFWRFEPSLWPVLLGNNIRHILGAARGRLFESTHSW